MCWINLLNASKEYQIESHSCEHKEHVRESTWNLISTLNSWCFNLRVP